jgi:hypothetical protein
MVFELRYHDEKSTMSFQQDAFPFSLQKGSLLTSTDL